MCIEFFAEFLEEGLKKIKELRKEFYTHVRIPGSKDGLNVELDKAIHLRDFLIMGELIAYDALNRNESCGGHFREESQTEEGEAKRDDENYCHVAAWEYQGDGVEPLRHIEELKFENVKLTQRSYK
jgi:succinate dehydrogenase / fumarate reductase flavoprotein subunit